MFCHKIGFPAIPPFVADIYDFRFVCKDICEMTYLFMGIDAEKYGDDGRRKKTIVNWMPKKNEKNVGGLFKLYHLAIIR